MMDKDNPDKPVLPPTSSEATKRMFDSIPQPPKRVADDAEIPEVKCDYCGAMVRIRRGGRCPNCTM